MYDTPEDCMYKSLTCNHTRAWTSPVS